MIKFDVLNWFTGHVQFTAEINCPEDAPQEIKLGLAVKWGVANGASLDGASLVGASLDGARLDGASLVRARLDGASLDGASLVRARLDGARLDGASLDGARLPHFQIPQEGELIVWKKLSNGLIAKLRVPPEARRTVSLVGRKCRAEWIEVIEIHDGKKKPKTGTGAHDNRTTYTVGEVTKPDSFDDDIRIECTHGIHFFLTRKEAEEY